MIARMLKKMLPKKRKKRPQAEIISRDAHTVSRAHIADHALRVLYRLNKAGYESYLVGGCVRDLLLGFTPKDFDIATNATPEEVKRQFSNCRLIGRRFRLAHVFFYHDIIEVATFRRGHTDADCEDAHSEEGVIVRDNVYGDMDEDALRRDFTINALYYNVKDFTIVDYVHGMNDIRARLVRMIGDPWDRFKEDPARLLRAIRFMSQLDFTLEAKTEAALEDSLSLIHLVAPSRLFLEFIKSFHKGHAVSNFKNLSAYGLFNELCPLTDAMQENNQLLFLTLCENTDERVRDDKPVSPGFLFAALLWPLVNEKYQELKETIAPYQAMEAAGDHVIRLQLKTLMIPRRFTIMMREVWRFQYLLERRHPRHSARLPEHKRFRAGFDLLWLRAHTGEPLGEYAQWWHDYQFADDEGRDDMMQDLRQSARK